MNDALEARLKALGTHKTVEFLDKRIGLELPMSGSAGRTLISLQARAGRSSSMRPLRGKLVLQSQHWWSTWTPRLSVWIPVEVEQHSGASRTL